MLRSQVAAYLNRVHGRIHPFFADQFLASLDSRPASDPMNNPALFTTLELVLSGIDGSLVRVAVVRPSGVDAFDAGALDSVQRAAPFGAPLGLTRSADGNVYVRWEFHRDPTSCSTLHAQPFVARFPSP